MIIFATIFFLISITAEVHTKIKVTLCTLTSFENLLYRSSRSFKLEISPKK